MTLEAVILGRRPSPVEIARALLLRDRRKYDPEDHSGPCQAIFESGRDAVDFPRAVGRHQQIVAQTDGGMIPVMTPDANRKDKRKGKTLSWREAKISLAHAKGSRTPVYGGGIEGGVEEAGRRLFACAVRAGFGADSRVHAVGDGAPWIVGQIEERFGEQGIYLIDYIMFASI